MNVIRPAVRCRIGDRQRVHRSTHLTNRLIPVLFHPFHHLLSTFAKWPMPFLNNAEVIMVIFAPAMIPLSTSSKV